MDAVFRADVEMTMRTKIARTLHRWVDLVGPRADDFGERLIIRVTCDTSEFDRALKQIEKKCLALAKAAGE